MEAFIGRQPILTVDKELYGYELLHRSSNQNVYHGFDGTQATATVISNSYLSFGLDQLSDQKRCFINFTEELLIDEVPTFFSSESIIVEILETVKITDEVVSACRKLKERGYKIALDDVVEMNNYEEIIHLIDIIKVDFMETSKQQRLDIVQKFNHLPITFLAEKVETLEEFEEAKELGYVLFQGYFFSKPVILTTRDVKPMPQQYVKMLEEINRPVPDISLVSELVERDLALSYKLLRLINSLGLPVKVSNIRQAIVLLGLFEVKKWIMILMLTKETNESSKVIQLSLIRSRLSERIARKIRINPSDASFIGMFSLLESILQRPISNILVDLPIEDHVKEALLDEDHSSIYAHVLKLVKAIERCNWESVDSMLAKINISMDDLQEDYFEAVRWANSVIGTFGP